MKKNDQPESLDQETIEEIKKGIESGRNGRRWSLEEAIEFAKKRRGEWKKVPDDQTA